MRGTKEAAISTRIITALCLLFLLCGLAQAEHLPVKTYTTADGLPRDQINKIVRDSRGFLWFCTAEGLSRFDGYSFTNYTTEQGLPSRNINDLIESNDGTYWVATDGGLARFNPQSAIRNSQSSEPLFVTYRMNRTEGEAVYTFLEERPGLIWCGTADGLYQLKLEEGHWAFQSAHVDLARDVKGNADILTILRDNQGDLWLGSSLGLYHLRRSGTLERFTTAQGLRDNYVQALLEDSDGVLWAGTREGGLCRIDLQGESRRAFVTRVYTRSDGLPSNWINSIFQSSDGRLWIGDSAGLCEFIPQADQRGGVFRAYATTNGLSDNAIEALAEDRDGNLWIGTESGGAMKLARSGFTTYGESDGLDFNRISAIFETAAGGLFVLSANNPTERIINSFNGARFTAVRPGVPQDIHYYGWGWNQVTFQDRLGEWWVTTGRGLYRFPKVKRVEQLAYTRPKAIYTSRTGLIADEVFRLFEDSHGDVWIATISSFSSGLTRWERTTSTFQSFSEADGIPKNVWATAFCEDGSGSLWIGTAGNGLLHYKADRFQVLSSADKVPEGWIRGLMLDKAHRLWIASQSGLGRIDDPNEERPQVFTYTSATGLSSNSVGCVTQDQFGRIYAGTARGVDRLDPATGRIRHYTTADGLANNSVDVAFRDHNGALWFGTRQGLSRLVPEPDRGESPPPVLINGLRVADADYQISQLGEVAASELTLEPDQNRLQISFVGLSFGAGEALNYQYTLEGADRDWSAPGDQRTVNYANLRPGRYRFSVRAVTSDGVVSASPATVAFTILPHVWQRWWFVVLTAMAAALALFSLYRYRVTRLLELERVRTRIATDLHDDIGAGLSRVAILSEVIKQQMGTGATQFAPMLTEIAESARGLVGSMRDIVWAIDPRRDDLGNVAVRIEQFASDVLEPKNIEWDFQAPAELERIKLNSDQRRHLLLIFKEAINNIANHSGCKSASLRIWVVHSQLVAEMRDDGRGFAVSPGLRAPTNGRSGHGLENMQRRADELGGHLNVESSPGGGTLVKLVFPLRDPRIDMRLFGHRN
jgi:ligand-binding sensor domain-containing protein/signal transduction histidine kinase